MLFFSSSPSCISQRQKSSDGKRGVIVRSKKIRSKITKCCIVTHALIKKSNFQNSEWSSCKVIYDYRPPHIWGYMCAFSHILGSPSSYMALQLLHSEFPYIWGKFDFLFYQCALTQESYKYIKLFPAPPVRVWLVKSRLGTGEVANLFLQCTMFKNVPTWHDFTRVPPRTQYFYATRMSHLHTNIDFYHTPHWATVLTFLQIFLRRVIKRWDFHTWLYAFPHII